MLRENIFRGGVIVVIDQMVSIPVTLVAKSRRYGGPICSLTLMHTKTHILSLLRVKALIVQAATWTVCHKEKASS